MCLGRAFIEFTHTTPRRWPQGCSHHSGHQNRWNWTGWAAGALHGGGVEPHLLTHACAWAAAAAVATARMRECGATPADGGGGASGADLTPRCWTSSG